MDRRDAATPQRGGRPPGRREAPGKTLALTQLSPEEKCSHCPGSICCTYLTVEIETPRSKLDFDNLLWQIAHRDTQLFKDDGKWCLLINNPCTHLQPDGRCGIYATRPQACREHSNDYCEFDAPAEDGFELFFPDYDSLLAYCQKRFKRWP